MVDVPVALFIYRRPELTARVFEVVRQVQPRVLLVVADGPRDAEEARRCQQAREIVRKIDWDCQIAFEFAEQNLGCGPRLATGLDWVFAQVDRAIILEDDTVPAPSFFGFCKAMLDRYEPDESVMQIGGCNLLGTVPSDVSYSFTKFSVPPWGWATWARSWRLYEYRMTSWDAKRAAVREWLQGSFPFWEKLVDRYRHAPVLSWDLQWNLALWMHQGSSVIPASNLVTNIGCAGDGTFVRRPGFYSELPAEHLELELRHPPHQDFAWDRELEPMVIRFIQELAPGLAT